MWGRSVDLGGRRSSKRIKVDGVALRVEGLVLGVWG